MLNFFQTTQQIVTLGISTGFYTNPCEASLKLLKPIIHIEYNSVIDSVENKNYIPDIKDPFNPIKPTIFIDE